ncbi:uncharacterized protein [Miscanthus floridulus]|uniref:uncharacterized protein isoform X2 n=1 Tax=Miscanthus floridulus TaxID=154761 RepID=UPI00345947D5
MGVEEEQDPREVRDLVLLHLPAGPDTTKNFFRRAAAAASSPSCGSVGSVPSAETFLPGYVSSSGSVPSAETLLRGYVSSSAPSVSSGSGRVPTGTDIDCSTSPLDADADEDTWDEILHGDISRGATGVVSEGDAGSTVTVSGAYALGPACVSVALSSDAAAAESSGMAFAEFRLGYLFSRRWLEICQGIPLVVHDVQLGSDNDREIMQTGERITMNLAEKISRVLYLHPGPVEVFRVDSSSWKEVNSLQWRVWIHKLISKNTKEIIICGRWPRSLMEFLPNNLAHCRSLQKIHLCFFSVPRITDNLAFPHLRELGLSHCVFENSDLDSILCNCKLLTLTLGCVNLAILSIRSETLRNLTMWNCSFDILCLSGMPNLLFFVQEPGRNFDHRSLLQLRGIPELRVISTIFLNQQTVELCGFRIKADMLDYPLCWSVTRLELVVTFCTDPFPSELFPQA